MADFCDHILWKYNIGQISGQTRFRVDLFQSFFSSAAYLQKLTDAHIVDAMQRVRDCRTKILSVTVLGSIILCQVLGALCPMSSSMFSAPDTVLRIPLTHTMPISDNPCQDSLISSEPSSKNISQHAITLSGHALTACVAVGSLRSDLAWLDHLPKYSLQTSPSVLRL